MTTYVDLEDADGLIQDTAGFDDAFWAQNQAAMIIEAAKYGKTLSPRTAAPSYAATSISNMTQFDSWVQVSRDTSGNPVTPPSSSTGGLTVLSVMGAGVAAAIAYWLMR